MLLNPEFKDLPEFCAAFHSVDHAPILIHKGDSGYWLLTTGEHPDDFNRRHGVTPAQREAMILGSMWGWNVPGARPSSWEGRSISENADDAPEDGDHIKALKIAMLHAPPTEPGESLVRAENRELKDRLKEVEAELEAIQTREAQQKERLRQAEEQERTEAELARRLQEENIKKGPTWGGF